jgi:hypothetical protein
VVDAVSLSTRVASDDQLARLLQIGIVLEEVVEARARRHYQSMVDEGRDPDPELEGLLREAARESAGHRERLDALVGALDAKSVPFDEVETLVTERYARTEPEDFDGVLYDQLCNEETAYKFYDDLIEAIEGSTSDFSLDREQLLAELRALREEEAEGVERVTELMDREGATAGDDADAEVTADHPRPSTDVHGDAEPHESAVPDADDGESNGDGTTAVDGSADSHDNDDGGDGER